MLKKIVITAMFVVLVPSLFYQMVLAQVPGERFTSRPVTKAELSEAIRKNDRRVLNGDCIQFVAASRQVHPNLYGGYGCAQYADYIDTTDVVTCPEGWAPLARIIQTKQGREVDLKWGRNFLPSEMCLYDWKNKIWVASLYCGNVIATKLLAQPAISKPDFSEEVKRVAAEQAKVEVVGKVEVGGEITIVHQGKIEVEHTGEVKLVTPPRERGWWEKNGKKVAILSMVGAAVGGALCIDTCFVNEVSIRNVIRR